MYKIEGRSDGWIGTMHEAKEKRTDMIAGVIFDIDGTILDSMPIWENAAERYLNGMGITADQTLGEILYAMSMTEGAKWLQFRYLPDLDVNAVISGVNRTIEGFYQHQVQLKDGVAPFLKAMKQVGIRMVAATSCDRQVVELALERLNIMGFFERIFTSSEIGVGKSDPAIYLAAAEHMGEKPGDIWVFEDALFAVQTAKKAGFKTVGVYDASSQKDWEEIRRTSDLSLEKLDNFDGFFEKASRLS